MKQVLKPLGHCLTTAVMTSAMLRVYAIPTVEAAVPNPANSQPSAEETLPATESSPDIASDPVPAAQAVSTPEVVNPIETPSPSPVLDQPKVSSPGGDSGRLESPTPEPEEPPLVNLSPSEPKHPPASPQKASSSTAPTVAGMRQMVEKRLAAIAEQDKISRDEKWRQNLIISALQAAWRGEFEQARKIAAHPALSAALQTELLAKIAAVEAQLNPSQVAQQPNGKKLSAQQQGNARRTNAQQANLPGRQVPSASFSSVFPSIAAYPGLGNQCPAIGTTQSPAQPTAQATPAKQTGKSGISTFVPSLSENLAARLVQLSNTQSVTASGKPTNLQQAFVAPQLFVGVAARSVHSKPVVSSTIATGLTTGTVKATAQPSHLKAEVTPIQPEVKAASIVAEAGAPAVLPHATESSNATRAANPSDSSTPKTDRLLATIEHLPLDHLIDQPSRPPAQSSAALADHPLEQVAVSLFHFIPDPLQQMWKWWTPESADAVDSGLRIDQPIGQQSLPPLEQSTTFTGLQTENLVIAAQTGLNHSLWQSWRLDLPTATPVAPIRSAYKFSALHFSTAKTGTAKLTQPTVFDANALLAASCARAQLANQFTDQVIDPTTSKQHGWVNLMFPLPIPAVVTSVFGWRTHPISGNLSFHTGLDLGAPMGTPVLAALEGQVVAADSMGGYGLAVVVESSNTQQRNLYGHLSGIAVQPGTHVTAGTILGWVGSTGNSTGPHLHFESMIHTQSGWTAIDPLATAALASSRTR